MKYKNAQDILPDHLLRELQQYVSGETMYVPNRGKEKKSWGETSGARDFYQKRNAENHILSYEIRTRKGEMPGGYFSFSCAPNIWTWNSAVWYNDSAFAEFKPA
ncbi:MAG: hypothetical protein HFH88_17590 [Lachnospiraceae bacterium]|nr:hypothetical protein [Lachnospiraceae bacterium]